MPRRRSADPEELAAAAARASRAGVRPPDTEPPASADPLQSTVGNAAVTRMIARSTSVQRAPNPGQQQARRLEDVLPREEWYRAYLDPLHHAEAREKHPENPGELYDHQQSPGFQASMTATYDRYLNDPETINDRVDFAAYAGMHDTVVSELKEKPDKSGAAGYVTSYPLRADSPTPSVLGETVGGRPLMVKADPLMEFGIRPDALTWSGHFERGVDMMLNQTLYKDDEVESLVTEVLDRFYEKLDAASAVRDRLKAIGWVVRTIHIIHPYDDTNRRLNVHVLLPRLLLAAGFQPVVFKDMEELFQGGRSLEQIADALESGQAADLLSDDIAATDPRYASDWYGRNRPPARETQGTIHIPSFESMGVTDDPAPSHQYFGQQAEDLDFFDPDLGGPGPAITYESGAQREELHAYLTESLRRAQEEAAQDQDR
ncbi:hypothetical protein ACGFZL_08440 [Streptomyces sp. NPDC048182]|uniref:hypothetical protein n=1 Tax=Streptomyces sp. NPDC048182 TaxID=3365507 RepID=UPI0037217541